MRTFLGRMKRVAQRPLMRPGYTDAPITSGYVRSGPASYMDTTGIVRTAAANTIRRTNTTMVTANYVPNPRGEYASSPTFPTTTPPDTWGTLPASGLSREITGQRLDPITGVVWTELHFWGTPNTTAAQQWQLSPAITISIGDPLTVSAYLQVILVAGAFNVGANPVLRNSGEATPNTSIPFGAAFQRYSVSFNTTGTTLLPTLRWQYPNTTDYIEFYIRVGGVQAERSLTLGPLTLPAAGTRGPVEVWSSNRILSETARTNIILNSDGTGADIDVLNNTLTTSPITAPDGSSNALRVTNTTGGATNLNYVQKFVNVPNDTTQYTYSQYMRKGNTPYSQIDLFITNGTIAELRGTVTWGALPTDTPTFTNCQGVYAGNGWWRVWTTVTNNASGNTLIVGRVYQLDFTSANVIGQYVDVWGWQIEVGSFPSSYISTGASAVTRNPDRFLVATSGLGLNYRAPVINRLLYSEQLDNAAWGKTGATVTVDATASPYGTTTADKIVEDTANSPHGVNQNVSLVAGQPFTLSAWFKAAERTWARIGFGGSTTVSVWFNLSNGTVGTQTISGGSITARIVAYPNGWYRCAITYVPDVTVTASAQLRTSTGDNITNHLGDGVSGLYAWGAQGTAGAAYTGAYSPTTNVAASKTPTGPFSVIIRGVMPRKTGNIFAGLFSLDDGTFNNRLYAFIDSSIASTTIANVSLNSAIGNQYAGTTLMGTITYGQEFVVAVAIGYNTLRASVNGQTIYSRSVANPLDLVNQFLIAGIGPGTSSGTELDGEIAHAEIVPYFMSDYQLQTAR